MAFSEMWQELRELGRIRLPLAAWARQSDAPAALREYAASRRTYVEWFNLHDGFVVPHSQEMAEGKAENGVIVVSMRGLNAILPAVPLNLKHGVYVESADGRSARFEQVSSRFQKIVPLGCGVLMEGAAFAIQRTVVSSLFGKEAAEDLHAWVIHRAPVETDPYLYFTVDAFLTRKLKKFYNVYQLAMTDAALMPAPDQTKPEDHPGMRFARLAQEAAKGPPSYEQLPRDISSWTTRLTHRLGWPNPVKAAQQAQKMWNEELGKLTGDTFWECVMRAFLSLHLNFLARRVAMPKLFADQSAWFHNLGSLPPPPIIRDTGQLAFLVKPGQFQTVRAWYFFEHFQRHMLFGTALPCAGDFHPHECPGDPFSARNWAPLDTCPYSQFLESMGITKLKIERLRT
jgi:hypothetical protein